MLEYTGILFLYYCTNSVGLISQERLLSSENFGDRVSKAVVPVTAISVSDCAVWMATVVSGSPRRGDTSSQARHGHAATII